MQYTILGIYMRRRRRGGLPLVGVDELFCSSASISRAFYSRLLFFPHPDISGQARKEGEEATGRRGERRRGRERKKKTEEVRDEEEENGRRNKTRRRRKEGQRFCCSHEIEEEEEEKQGSALASGPSREQGPRGRSSRPPPLL